MKVGIYNIYPIIFILFVSRSLPQQNVNYDEIEVPEYELPQLLVSSSGISITDPEEWYDIRRSEILKLFEENVYGKTPELKIETEYDTLKIIDNALNGKGVLKEITAKFYNLSSELKMDILIITPKNSNIPAPLFLGMNFNGNHTIHSDTNISITKSWVRNNADAGILDNRAVERSRGISKSRWPVEIILDRGYGIATIYYGDIDPDYDDGFNNGVHQFNSENEKEDSSFWGSIAAWAWGLSRAMDYFEEDDDIDHKNVILMGHSRLGKTALWAGAQDNRFAVVISNNSGCGGAALFKREFGERIENINSAFPHWFSKSFRNYNGKENILPLDQHMLISLIAPRPIYVASAEEDLWADPKGEFLSLKHSAEVYNLFNSRKININEMPSVNTPIIKNNIGYHIRSGKHDVTIYDWERYMEFSDRFINNN